MIYTDNFESGATGWSSNITDSAASPVTTFLGRFDNSPSETSRTFALPAGTGRVELAFDFYRFDSWDNNTQWGFDRWQVEVDGVQLFSLPFSTNQAARSGTTGDVDWSITPLAPASDLGFNSGQPWYRDQRHRVVLDVETSAASLDLLLRTALNQGGSDESGGYDNFTVTAFPALPVIAAAKTAEVVGGGHHLPGSEVDYTISLSNAGGPPDAGSVTVVDSLPDDVELFTGDLDGSGEPVVFSDDASTPSGWNCCSGATVEFSDTTSGAPVFGYVPVASYDPAIRHLRITPAGTPRDARPDTVDVSFRFRARIP